MSAKRLRFFFVAYCFGDYQGQSLIGVYKRGIRVGLTLAERGHEIVFFCTGREDFHDDLTDLAEKQFRFIDIRFSVAAFDEAAANRNRFRKVIEDLAPDVVVIGEAPLAGAMLEATLTAVELGIPVVVLDNAYNDLAVKRFLDEIGPIADGVVLTGPSSHHMTAAPPYVCQVAPLVEPDLDGARALVNEIGLDPDALVTVLGYDRKTQQVGLSLAPTMAAQGATMVVVSRDPAGCQDALSTAPEHVRSAVRAIGTQSEPVFFGLLAISRLAVVKYGFMQVTECLALRTPVIAVYHEGPTWLDALPRVGRRFTHVTDRSVADASMAEMATKLFSQTDDDLAHVHDGRLDAASQVADFLESRGTIRRSNTPTEAAVGITPEHLSAALGTMYPGTLEAVAPRSIRLRETRTYDLYCVLATFRRDGEPTAERLWVRRYRSRRAARRDRLASLSTERWRQVLDYSPRQKLLVEVSAGEAKLPELNP